MFTPNRRLFIASLLALPVARGLITSARAEEKLACTKWTMNEEGLHEQPWFIQNSFLDLKEELQTAKEANKRLVIVVEREGCPYCAKMHEVYFQKPEICDFVRRHFAFLQINQKGAREVTDFDGETLPESKWYRKYKAFFTPNIMFFDDDVENMAFRTVEQRIVARMDGLWPADAFLAVFRYVWDRGYEKGGFVKWLTSRKNTGG